MKTISVKFFARYREALGVDEVALVRKQLGWTAEAFVIPDEVLKPWREAGSRGAAVRKEWEGRLAASSKKAARVAWYAWA